MAKFRRGNSGGGGRRGSTALKTALAGVAGGAAGALAGALMTRAGVSPKVSAAGITVAGAVGAMTLTGPARAACGGAAAAGAGQMALSWLAAKQAQAPAQVAAPGAPRQLASADIARAFGDVRNQMSADVDEEIYIVR